MKLITRDTDYAVRALRYISEFGEEIVSAKCLVSELAIPRPFLRKILQRLNKAGILKSYKGKGGGFILCVPAEKIYLTDLIRIFQGPLKLNECLFKKNICPNKGLCVLRKKMGAIEKRMLRDMEKITIASLVRKGR